MRERLLAAERLIALQSATGIWEGEVVWCPVITAQVVMAHAIMGRAIPVDRQRLILLHFARTRRPDGGWGLHPESHSYLFVTTMVYVAARLLGAPPDGALLRRPAAWLGGHAEGLGALPSWGRFWLVLLGLMDRDRLTPCPPEFFLLPRGFPLAPDRLYCHMRAIYLGMAYLTGRAVRADLGEMSAVLRRELAAFTRLGPAPPDRVAATDVHVPPGPWLRGAYWAMRKLAPLWRKLPGSGRLRRHALGRCLGRIRAAQAESSFMALSPVNGVLHTLALWSHDPHAAETAASSAGLDHWCWEDEVDGRRTAGARSAAWDSAFALQSLVEAGDVAPAHVTAIRRGYAGLAALQLAASPKSLAEGRQDPSGGWCFGEPAHGWTVSDCTAEAISALLLCHRVPGLIPAEQRIAPARVDAAVRFLLARQNADGGFATYERRRAGAWLERLNPSEMFGSCMTEGSYIECTASAIRGLRHVLGLAPESVDGALKAACSDAIGRGRAFLLRMQREDGAWPGFWGINFIYATCFAVAALLESGLQAEDEPIRRAVAWLCRAQQTDGGWGEHFSGCLSGTFVANPASLVISTSWAVLALLRASGANLPEARRGIAWLAAHQTPDGSWPRDSVNGVFFGTAMLEYRLYTTYFPLWALHLSQRTEGFHCLPADSPLA